MAMGLLIVPLVFAAIAALVPSNRLRPWLLPVGSGAHLLLTIQALGGPGFSALENWIVLDNLGKLFLGVISVLHFLCMCYAPGYLRLRSERPNRVLCACL